jgi:uncharacterized protein with FMN-binding domain
VFLCAPAALAAQLVAELRAAGVPGDRIHREMFELASSSAGRVRQIAAASVIASSIAAVLAARNAPHRGAVGTDQGGAVVARQVPAPARPGRPDVVVVAGSLQRTSYASVQVAAVLRHGRLVDVRALALPSLDARSRQISAMVAPILRREAIAAGSAHIDTVSGATFTSAAYAQSLQAALDAQH